MRWTPASPPTRASRPPREAPVRRPIGEHHRGVQTAMRFISGHRFGGLRVCSLKRAIMGLTSDDISRLFTRHAEELLGYCARRTLQAEVAVELVGETFAQAFMHREDFRGQGDRAAIGWIYGIARRQLADYFRRGQVHRRALQRLGVTTPDLLESDFRANRGARGTQRFARPGRGRARGIVGQPSRRGAATDRRGARLSRCRKSAGRQRASSPRTRQQGTSRTAPGHLRNRRSN